MDKTTTILQVVLQGLVFCSLTSAYISTYCEAQDGSELKIYCNYGCCGNHSLAAPCCEENDVTSSSMPPFSIFFYALTIFILFLLIVCCVGRVARLKNRQSSTSMQGRRPSDRHSFNRSSRAHSELRRTLVIATIESLIRMGRQSGEPNQTTEEPSHTITDVPMSPPSYDDAIKTAPPELPPPYSEAVNEHAVISPSVSDHRYI